MSKTYDETEEREWIIQKLISLENQTDPKFSMGKISNITVVCTIARITGESVLSVAKEAEEVYELIQKLWREM